MVVAISMEKPLPQPLLNKGAHCGIAALNRTENQTDRQNEKAAIGEILFEHHPQVPYPFCQRGW